MTAATHSATQSAANAAPPDSGLPVQVNSNVWLYASGARDTHSGFGPVSLSPPADEIECALLQRCYHLAKLKLAETVLRDVRTSRIHCTQFRWDHRLWGALPTRATGRGTIEPDLGAAVLRMEVVTRWHADNARALDERLRSRGVDPDRCPRV